MEVSNTMMSYTKNTSFKYTIAWCMLSKGWRFLLFRVEGRKRFEYATCRCVFIYLFIFLNLRFQKCPDTCGWGFRQLVVIQRIGNNFQKEGRKEPFLEFFVSFVFLFCFVFWFVAFPIYMCVFVYSIKLLSWRCSYRCRFIIEDKDGDCRSSWWWRFAFTYPCHHHHHCIFSFQKVG